jgi:ABC-type cobalamin transport system permease subunit
MFTLKEVKVAGVLTALLLSAPIAAPALADWDGYRGYASNTRCGWDVWKQEHPKVKTAVVDGAVGTAAGALVGAVSGRGALHGALVGAGTGAGIGLVRSSVTMHEHPVAKTVSEVGLGGLGLFLAAHHGHNM